MMKALAHILRLPVRRPRSAKQSAGDTTPGTGSAVEVTAETSTCTFNVISSFW